MVHENSEQVNLLKDVVDGGVLLLERCGEQLEESNDVSIDRNDPRTAMK